jgi:plasmid stabilization system protein ParE
MSYDLKVELQALDDLKLFLENADYENAAVRHVQKIFGQTQILKQFPKIGSKIFAQSRQITARKKWVHPFWIIYTIDERKSLVRIIEYRHHAKHQGRNLFFVPSDPSG